MSAADHSPRRVRQSHVDWLSQRLNERDWHILEDVARVRLLTGHQLERLHFSTLTGRSRSVVRWRVLKRLTDWRLLATLSRRIGGSGYGSAGAVFALDTAGQAILRGRIAGRRPTTPGERFTAHVLAGSELYVQLVNTSGRAAWSWWTTGANRTRGYPMGWAAGSSPMPMQSWHTAPWKTCGP